MQRVRIDHARQREMALADGVGRVASDLRLIDLTDLVAYIKTGEIASAGALVQSSIELSFKPNTLSFGYSADAVLDWGRYPEVVFDFEFHHQAVHVYFRLQLEAEQAGVEITYIAFDEASANPESNTRRLIDSLRAAQIDGSEDSPLLS